MINDDTCAICGTLRIHEQYDGKDLVPVVVELFGRHAEALLCVDCSSPFKAILRTAGHPPWAVMGWPTKEDAVKDGWSPRHPDRDPFADLD